MTYTIILASVSAVLLAVSEALPFVNVPDEFNGILQSVVYWIRFVVQFVNELLASLNDDSSSESSEDLDNVVRTRQPLYPEISGTAPTPRLVGSSHHRTHSAVAPVGQLLRKSPRLQGKEAGGS